jgi:hypothetical protein
MRPSFVPRGLTLIWYGFSSLCLGLIAASSLPTGLPIAWQAATGSPLEAGTLTTLVGVTLALTLILTLTFTVTGVFELFAELFSRDDEGLTGGGPK